MSGEIEKVASGLKLMTAREAAAKSTKKISKEEGLKRVFSRINDEIRKAVDKAEFSASTVLNSADWLRFGGAVTSLLEAAGYRCTTASRVGQVQVKIRWA